MYSQFKVAILIRISRVSEAIDACLNSPEILAKITKFSWPFTIREFGIWICFFRFKIKWVGCNRFLIILIEYACFHCSQFYYKNIDNHCRKRVLLVYAPFRTFVKILTIFLLFCTLTISLSWRPIFWLFY